MGPNKTDWCQFQIIFNFPGKCFPSYAEHYFSWKKKIDHKSYSYISLYRKELGGHPSPFSSNTWLTLPTIFLYITACLP